MTVFCLTACGEADVTSISLDASGAVTEYEVGDEFSADGLKVTAEMSDGTRKSVDIGDCDISRPDMSVDGAVTVTVTYEGKTASYEIVISERTERFDLMSFSRAALSPFFAFTASSYSSSWEISGILFISLR